MNRILLAWIGKRDLEVAEADPPSSAGPTGSVLAERDFDGVVLLSDYAANRTAHYIEWLKDRTKTPIHLRQEALDDPTDHDAICHAVFRTMDYVEETFGKDVGLVMHLSPGTPSMHAVWVLLGKTKFQAELIKSSTERGISTVHVPFDISAEYIPDLVRRPDEKLARLSAGLPPEAPEFDAIIRRSAVMERAVARARRLAGRSVPVLIEGETGTGKELFVRAMTRASPREDKPFVVVNCGAIPNALVESVLFGHEKGAFTGAVRRQEGKFESANGGTLFLDELGELSLDAQVKLLRVLEYGETQRVGGTVPVRVDVRVLAATNKDLRHEIAEGKFREDLYHRIAVGVVRLPALRDRQGDIGLLIDHLLGRINLDTADQPGHTNKKLSPAARNLLLQQPWPGNVRQLHNALLRLSLWSADETITVDDVRDEMLEIHQGSPADVLGRPIGNGFDINELVSTVTRHYLERALREADGNKTKAATLIGLANYQTFSNWMERHGVGEPRASQSK